MGDFRMLIGFNATALAAISVQHFSNLKSAMDQAVPQDEIVRGSAALGGRALVEIVVAFGKLGLISFGGPVAHLGYFRAEFVERRRWLSDADYADLVALCQFLPGPASSQTVFALGMRRGGLIGAMLASLCFTMPSAVLMIAFAYGVAWAGDLSHAGWLHGLKLAAVAVVAQAVWGMGKQLCPDRPRLTLAAVAAGVILWVPSAVTQVAVIAAGALVGWVLYRGVVAREAAKGTSAVALPVVVASESMKQDDSAPRADEGGTPSPRTGAAAVAAFPVRAGRDTATGGAQLAHRPDGAADASERGATAPTDLLPPASATREGAAVHIEDASPPRIRGHVAAAMALLVCVGLLVVLPAVASSTGSRRIAVFDSFYRAGSLVFGGGHVVLPLLRAEVVPKGWVVDDAFLAGYGAAQAVPGPLFTFSAYLGTSIDRTAGAGPATAWLGGLWCLLAIFLPAWLLIGGALPFWQTLRRKAWAQASLRGANAAVVGVLLAALYNPVIVEGVNGPRDVAAALLAFVALHAWKLPPWLLVGLTAGAGEWVLR
jgi:chromate transporter